MKKQVVIVGGGTSFDKYQDYLSYLKNKDIEADYFKLHLDWKDTLQEKLGKNYEVFSLRMPNKTNSKYREWKIWFERVIPFVKNNVILIGHSLGGMFLAKYLSTTTFPQKISATILVAAPFDGEGRPESLSEFKLPKSLSKLKKQGRKIFIVHSKDDPVVDFKQAKKYERALPEAEMLTLKNRGHFNQKTFLEIQDLVKIIYKVNFTS